MRFLPMFGITDRGNFGRWSAVAVIAATACLALSSPGFTQTGPGSQNQGRDCKTVLTCNFARGAEVRGCLSSYTCRTCSFVNTSCRIGNAPGTCRKIRCGWGG